jgi:hypothetical protein
MFRLSKERTHVPSPVQLPLRKNLQNYRPIIDSQYLICCIHLDGIDSNCLQHSVGSHFCTHSAKLLDASYYKQSILVYIYTFLTCVLSLDNRNIALGSLSDSTFLDVLTSKLQYSFLVYVVSYSIR